MDISLSSREQISNADKNIDENISILACKKLELLMNQNEDVNNILFTYNSLKKYVNESELLYQLGMYGHSNNCSALTFSCLYKSYLYGNRNKKLLTELSIAAYYKNLYWLSYRLNNYLLNRTDIDKELIINNNKFNLTKIKENKINFKIKCINLKRRPDRLESFTKKINSQNIENFDIFCAFNGKELKKTKYYARLFANNDFGGRRGVIGAALSHYKIWEMLLNDDNNDAYLIFEDDVNLVDNFKDRLLEAYFQLNTKHDDWDVLYLGQTLWDSIFEKHKNVIRNYSNNVTDVRILNANITGGGLFGYIINKKGCRKVVKYINNNGIISGIDNIIMKRDNKLKQFECIPHICTSDPIRNINSKGDSDIQKDYHPIY